MLEFSTDIRVRYAETDRMTYVHHATYPVYLEEARMKFFRSQGIDVLQLEKDGIILPVVSIQLRYLKPLFFGDSITVNLKLDEEAGTRMDFTYRIIRGEGELIAKAKTSLVFADKEEGTLRTDIQFKSLLK